MDSFDSSDGSSTSKHSSASTARAVAVQYLAHNRLPSPWNFSRPFASLKWDSRAARDVALLPYAKVLQYPPTNRASVLELCAVQGSAGGEAEVAEVLSPESYSDAFDRLKKLGVVPSFAAFHLPCNIISLSKEIHSAFADGGLTFIPSLDTLLVRLVAEYLHFHAILEAGGAIARPPFGALYARLESAPAVVEIAAELGWPDPIMVYRKPTPPRFSTDFKLPRMGSDDGNPAYAALPPYPPLLLPISTNLLIYAMQRRIRHSLPASYDLVERTEVLQNAAHHLLRFWFIRATDSPDEHRAFLNTVKNFVLASAPPDAPYLAGLNNPDAFSPSTVPLPPPPPGARDTRSDCPCPSCVAGENADLQALGGMDEMEFDGEEIPSLKALRDPSAVGRATREEASERLAGWLRALRTAEAPAEAEAYGTTERAEAAEAATEA
ncbi:hypothetical protein JCM10213_005750 [Rhodosporidiobolus nylandii]